MPNATRYIVFIERIEGERRCYPHHIDLDGRATMLSGDRKAAAVYIDRSTAEASANRWGCFLHSIFSPAGSRIRIAPKTGGACTSYRYAGETS